MDIVAVRMGILLGEIVLLLGEIGFSGVKIDIVTVRMGIWGVEMGILAGEFRV
jgi:hypothetical protein